MWDSGEMVRDDVTGSLLDYGPQANIIPSSDHVLRNLFSLSRAGCGGLRTSVLMWNCLYVDISRYSPSIFLF